MLVVFCSAAAKVRCRARGILTKLLYMLLFTHPRKHLHQDQQLMLLQRSRHLHQGQQQRVGFRNSVACWSGLDHSQVPLGLTVSFTHAMATSSSAVVIESHHKGEL